MKFIRPPAMIDTNNQGRNSCSNGCVSPLHGKFNPTRKKAIAKTVKSFIKTLLILTYLSNIYSYCTAQMARQHQKHSMRLAIIIATTTSGMPRIIWPIISEITNNGVKAAMVVRDDAKTGAAISIAPLSEASIGPQPVPVLLVSMFANDNCIIDHNPQGHDYSK